MGWNSGNTHLGNTHLHGQYQLHVFVQQGRNSGNIHSDVFCPTRGARSRPLAISMYMFEVHSLLLWYIIQQVWKSYEIQRREVCMTKDGRWPRPGYQIFLGGCTNRNQGQGKEIYCWPNMTLPSVCVLQTVIYYALWVTMVHISKLVGTNWN